MTGGSWREERQHALEGQLRDLFQDVEALEHRVVEAERQAQKLMSLYVATYQLHSTLDPAEVRGIIAEIAINLLGAERFALLLRADDERCDIVLAEGLVQGQDLAFHGDVYLGGEPVVDEVLADGMVRVVQDPGAGPLAVVPLIVQQATVGALVILKMFGHKHEIDPQDRDLLDMLGAHAASALFVAQVHATADRKLRTLETLVKLARQA